MPDGSVEMIACGRQENIDNCIKELKEAFAGGIAEIKTEEIPQSKDFKEFKITF
jgi:acylphosphatase